VSSGYDVIEFDDDDAVGDVGIFVRFRHAGDDMR
jgi:hypothetical protein